MEPFEHSHHSARKKNSAKTNVILSIVFHAVLVIAGALWAAHEGMLGDKLKTLSASILDKEKKLEAKKVEPKQEEVKKIEQPKLTDVVKATAPPPPPFVPPPAAGAPPPPPPVVLGGGDFALSQDALTGGDPVAHYRQSVETTLRTRWDRPSDIDDTTFVAEVELALNSSGQITGHEWKKGSGDKRWDDSVRKVVAGTKSISRPPPSGFPEKFLVRFDVETGKTEPVIQASVH